MARTDKFYIKNATLLWPRLFVPSRIDSHEEPKYRASFLLPDDFVPPSWAFVKETDGRYDLPAGRRYISTQSLNPAAVFGIDESVIRAAQNTMQSLDRLLIRAEVDAIIESWEGSDRRVFLTAQAIRVLTPIVVPGFENFLGGLK